MISTLLLLLPVAAMLVWVYWFLLPERRCWTRFDSVLIVFLSALATCWVAWVMAAPLDGAGPLWPHVLSAIGVYCILAVGMAAGLAWRRRTPVVAEPGATRQQT